MGAGYFQSSAVDIKMSPYDPLSLELLWDMILSRDPDKIMDAYEKLKPEEKDGVLEHLKRMTTEEGWHDEQVQVCSDGVECHPPETC